MQLFNHFASAILQVGVADDIYGGWFGGDFQELNAFGVTNIQRQQHGYGYKYFPPNGAKYDRFTAIQLFWKFVVKGTFARPRVDWRFANINIGFAWDTSFLGRYANDPSKTWDELTAAQKVFRVVNVGFSVKLRNLLSQKHTRCETFCDGMFDPDWKYYPADAVYSPLQLFRGKTATQPGVKSNAKLAHSTGDYHDLMRKCANWMEQIREIGNQQDIQAMNGRGLQPVPRLFIYAS